MRLTNITASGDRTLTIEDTTMITKHIQANTTFWNTQAQNFVKLVGLELIAEDAEPFLEVLSANDPELVLPNMHIYRTKRDISDFLRILVPVECGLFIQKIQQKYFEISSKPDAELQVCDIVQILRSDTTQILDELEASGVIHKTLKKQKPRVI